MEMKETKEKEKTFAEKLWYALLAINDNVVTLAGNVAEIHKRLDAMEMNADPFGFDVSDLPEFTTSCSDDMPDESEDTDEQDEKLTTRG